MQHQYWVTKTSVLRKLGGKEDDCVVSSDAELDAKLELFKSINDSCLQLQRVIDLYQERLCYLAQEENALGRYMKECGKNEKNVVAAQLLQTAGKSLAYIGHQRLTIRPPLVRLHHEVDTFRSRGVADTRTTVMEMEKIRTEYRAALSWMKSSSAQLDPDTGHGLEKFRKAQSYVKAAKTKFDRFTLACLQKVDLLAAARCNMFSHALVPYQKVLLTFSNKSLEAFALAMARLDKVEPYDFSAIAELATPFDQREKVDKDKNTFFNSEYSDKKVDKEKKDSAIKERSIDITNLLGEDFSQELSKSNGELDNLAKNPSTTLNSDLLNLEWPSTNTSATSDFLLGDFMPSKLLQDDAMFNFKDLDLSKLEASPQKQVIHNETKDDKKNPEVPKKVLSKRTDAQMSWLSLFAELDPLANQDAGLGGDNQDRA